MGIALAAKSVMAESVVLLICMARVCSLVLSCSREQKRQGFLWVFDRFSSLFLHPLTTSLTPAFQMCDWAFREHPPESF